MLLPQMGLSKSKEHAPHSAADGDYAGSSHQGASQPVKQLTADEQEQLDEDAIPSAVATGGVFTVFGAGVGAFIDAHRNKKLVKELQETAAQHSRDREEKSKKMGFGPATQDILQGSDDK